MTILILFPSKLILKQNMVDVLAKRTKERKKFEKKI